MEEISVAKFYLDTPLYTPIVFDKVDTASYYVNGGYDNSFTGFNPYRKHETTFMIEGSNKLTSYGQIFEVRLICKRTDETCFFFLEWDSQKQTLTKVGQSPSVADFNLNDVEQYSKVLSKAKVKEFKKAIGLAANGIGIGSFVYLRRIFEELIYNAHKDYEVDKKNAINSFDKIRMNEKIEALKEYLPEFLVEKKALYGILSKGIHELEEKECLAYFDTVKIGIEMILDEKLEKYNKQIKISQAKLKIDQATSKLGKSLQNEG